MQKQIYEILFYLSSNEVIMMTDHLRLTNRYKVSFRVLQKSEEELNAEFVHFVAELESKAVNVDCSKLCIKKFLICLNNGMDVYQAMTQGVGLVDTQENRNFVYYFWLYSHYSKYITRLYEVPIKLNPKDEDFQKAKGHEAQILSEKPDSPLTPEQMEENKLSLLAAGLREYENKDELVQKLKVNEAYYYDLLARVMSKEQQAPFRLLTE